MPAAKPAPAGKADPRQPAAAGTLAATAELADRITRDIQSGIYPVGSWLRQIELERRYGRNRNAIRRALERLAELRVIAHVHNRGFHVFEADAREETDIQDLRVVVETAAAERIVGRLGAADIERLGRLAARFAALIEGASLTELYDANLAFHRAFLGHCPNRELAALAEMLRKRISSAPAAQWRERARIEQSAREHLEMVAALGRRDTRRLKSLISAHILQAE